MPAQAPLSARGMSPVGVGFSEPAPTSLQRVRAPMR